MSTKKAERISNFASKIREIFIAASYEASENNMDNLKKIVIDLEGTIDFFEDDTNARFEEVKKTGEDSFEICIDKCYCEKQQMFTIAHEIGHLFLHMGFGTDKWRDVKIGYNYNKVVGLYSAVEGEANEFARAFLMPKDSFEKVADAKSNNIEEIAKHFCVFEREAYHRGRGLGLWP